MSGRRQYHVDFTSDTDVLRDAVVAFARAAEAPIPREFAPRVASETFRAAVELFAAVPHRRKVLELVSDGTAVAPRHAGAEVRLLRQRPGGRQNLEGLAAAMATGTIAGGLVALGGWPLRLTVEPEPIAGSADGTRGGAVAGAAAAKTPRGVALTIDLAESVVSGWTDVAVQAIAVDGTGTVRAGRRVGGPVAPLPRVEVGWVRLETRLAVPPGRYQVRVVAARAGVEATARKAEDVGSVFAYVSVP